MSLVCFRLTGGTTWHAAGLITQARDDLPTSKLMQYSRKLYEDLEADGQNLCMLSKAAGNESHIITPQEAKSLCPLLKVDDLEGALWIPGDGALTAPDVALTFASLAKEMGAKIFERVGVESVVAKRRVVSHVETTAGKIECEYFVNCAGMVRKCQ
uniref:Pyruvate dehydrogenase phosphatase regulatory subunit, mitochondrial n=1 Tax=Magallana gigas TaxID=29159 RepID=K1Q819_MAGGI